MQDKNVNNREIVRLNSNNEFFFFYKTLKKESLALRKTCLAAHMSWTRLDFPCRCYIFICKT